MTAKTLLHYRIVEQLGRGGMGIVYRAIDTKLNREVALKLLPPDRLADPVNKQRFLREAQAASALNHPNIITIHEINSDGDVDFIAMEYVRGQTLHEILQERRLSLDEALRYAVQIAGALTAAHSAGIIHRDLKPGNIMVREDGLVKVLDFGLAKLDRPPESGGKPATDETVTGPLTAVGTTVGTAAYMSPEQSLGTDVDARSDIFSFGVLLYEMFSGRRPFSGSTQSELLRSLHFAQPAALKSLRSEVPEDLDRLVSKTLEKNPELRYQTMAALTRDLTAIAGLPSQGISGGLPVGKVSTRPAAGTKEKWSKIASNRVRRSPIAAALVLAAVLAAAFVGWRLMRSAAHEPSPEALRWYQEGVNALRDGTYYKASKALAQAVSLDDQFSLAHARLAEAWLELDYSDKAREEMLRAMPLGSTPSVGRSDTLYLQAIHLTLTGDSAGAVDKYREIVARAPGPEKFNAYVDLGRAYEKNEKPKDAIQSYLEATRHHPEYPSAFLRLGILYGRQQDQAKAEAAFQSAESLYRSLSNIEGATEVLYQRAVLATRLGKGKDAQLLLERALDMARSAGNSHQEIMVLLQLSTATLRNNDATQAERYATDAIELGRTNGLEILTTQGLINLGNAYFIRGEHDKAVLHFTQAVDYAHRYKAQRTEARALLSLGSLRIQSGETADGLKNVEQALTFYLAGGYQKETAQALILTGRARRRQGDYDAAFHAFDQQLQLARKVGDQSQVALSEEGLGSVLLAQERFPEALAHFREQNRVSRLISDQVAIGYSLLNMGDSLWALGRYAEATALFDEASALANRPGGYQSLQAGLDQAQAEIALSQRRFAAAKEASRQLLARKGLGTDSAIEIRCVLGVAQAFSGERSQAVASTQEAVSLAEKAGIPALMSMSLLANSEALAEAGNGAKAVPTALAAQEKFSHAGKPESEWRSWAVAARSAASLGDVSHAQEYAAKAAAILAGLEQRWNADDFKSYLARLDVQYERSRIARISRNK